MKKLLLLLCLFLLAGCTPKETTITISFQSNGALPIAAIESSPNSTLLLPTPSKEGYTFDGWQTDSTIFFDEGVFTTDVTLYARWKTNSYTVIFLDYDESIISTQDVHYQGDATLPSFPTRTGYSFTGWDVSHRNITSNTTITAQYEIATDGLEFELFDHVYILRGYHGEATDIVVPRIYNTYPVREIGNDAFAEQPHITSITLPDTIQKIGDRAFYECSSLTDINIPTQVQIIGKLAFYSCESLISITIPTPVIDESAFHYCSHLKNIILLDSVTTLSGLCFYGCADLTTIFIPDSVNAIGNHIFSWCRSLTTVITPEANVVRLQTMIDNTTLIYLHSGFHITAGTRPSN
ncbi:MAG: leucine-rich repeat protein [Bacilli bacterium]